MAISSNGSHRAGPEKPNESLPSVEFQEAVRQFLCNGAGDGEAMDLSTYYEIAVRLSIALANMTGTKKTNLDVITDLLEAVQFEVDLCKKSGQLANDLLVLSITLPLLPMFFAAGAVSVFDEN